MITKTTINIKQSYTDEIHSISSRFNVTFSYIINVLIKKALKKHSFTSRLLSKVAYQKRLTNDTNDYWRCQSVSFQPDIYEKCLDLRNVSKISVSFFISSAFRSFIDEVIKELEMGIDSDNYSANYVIFQSSSDGYNIITHIWDIPTEDKLIQIQKLHI